MGSTLSLRRKIGKRPIVIWGARMTGIGLVRYAKAHGINVLAFIDSDTSLAGQQVNGIPVYLPDVLTTIQVDHPNVILVIAVSIKEKEILLLLNALGLSKLDRLVYSDFSDLFYTIDVVGTCNLKCLSCAHSIEKHNVPRGVMKYKDFTRVVDKIIDESKLVTHISLYSWGEPFLHPEIDKIVRYLHDRNIAVALSSNLSIRFEDRLEKVMEQSPDYLKISTSGYFPEAYNNTHAGGDVNLVKSNLYKLRYLLDKYNVGTLVDVNYHLYRDNNGINLQKMQDLCGELGFVLSTVHALVMPLERVIRHCEGSPDFQTKLLTDNLLVDIDEGIAASQIDQDSAGACGYRDNQVNINSDLTVPVCCTVFNRDSNVVAENFLESSPDGIQEKKNSAEICKKCMAYGLPAYNMGFNREDWNKIASGKESRDVGQSTSTLDRVLNSLSISSSPQIKRKDIA